MLFVKSCPHVFSLASLHKSYAWLDQLVCSCDLVLHNGAISRVPWSQAEVCECVGTTRAVCCGEQKRKDDGVPGFDGNAAGVVSNVLHSVVCSCDASQAGMSRH